MKFPEEGRDPPTIFVFRTARLARSHRSQSVLILQHGRGLLSDYAQHLISLHDYRHNVERNFSLMTEHFRDEWGNEVVLVQLLILIKELGDHVGHNAAPLGWPDLYCATKEGRLPPRVRCDYFRRPV